MRLAERLTRAATTFLGVVLAVTPVTFWIAWTPGLLFGAMAVALISAALLVVLTELSPSDEDGNGGPVELPEGFIDEVHRLFPLTYHHSAAGPSRFRQAMKRLSGSS